MRFDQQVDNSSNYVVPFIEQTLTLTTQTKVLEIGCGEGGVLKPFLDRGCSCVGVDLDQIRIDLAHDFLKDEIASGKLICRYKNVFDQDFQSQYHIFFDLIILKDVIEHIPDQETFIPFMKSLLKPGGQIFFGFPPWYMPFGGHQQVARTKWASKIPYYHILPKAMYLGLVKWMGEAPDKIQELREIWETRISIERFERIVKKSGYTIVNRCWYLINPIYKFKFGLKPRKQFSVLGAVPFFRNFVTTCAYYTIQKD